MAAREIKTRFRLEGESEYRRAMKESAEAIKVLASEQKLAAAEFEATGDAQEYAAETARILKDQIREQEKAVKAAQQAVERLKAAGVDPADKSMQQWNTRLNTAKTRLLNMQTQLEKANTDLQENKGKLDESEGSAKGFGDQLDRIGKNIDFTATITAIDNLKGKIEGVLKTAARVAKGFWDMETDAGKWADDLTTAASKAGMDVETYQSWQYASQLIDTEVSKISSTITKLEKELGSENKEVAKAFNQLQVSTRAAGSGVRDATEVFWDVIDALHKVEDPTKRSIYAQQLLGESWKDLNPLIEAGSQAYKDLAKEGLETATVSEKNVSKLGEMNDAQNKLNASIEKAKFDTLAALAPTFTEVSNALNTAVGALNEFLQSKEGQEALGNLNEALSGVIKSFLGEDGGKGTFQSIVEGASGAIQTFNDALTWIKDNGDTVEGIVLGLVGAWATLTISKDVLTVLQLLQHIPLDKLTAVFGGHAAGAAVETAAKAAGDAATNAAPAVTGAASGFAPAIGAALPYAELILVTGAVGATLDKSATEREFGDFNKNMEAMPDLLKQAADEKIQRMQGILEGFSEAMKDFETNDDPMSDRAASIKETFRQHANELLESMPELNFWKMIGDSIDLSDGLDASEIEKAIESVEQAWDWLMLGRDVVNGMADGIQEGQSDVEGAADAAASGAATGAEARLADGSMEIIGYNASIGLANGIINGQDAVIAAAEAVAQSAQNTMASALEIHSPSRVMARLGAYVAQGFAEGIDRGAENVQAAVSRMAGAAFRAPVIAQPQSQRFAQAAPAPVGASGVPGSVSGQQIQAVIMMDKKTVGYMVAPVVNEAIGAIVQEARI